MCLPAAVAGAAATEIVSSMTAFRATAAWLEFSWAKAELPGAKTSAIAASITLPMPVQWLGRTPPTRSEIWNAPFPSAFATTTISSPDRIPNTAEFPVFTASSRRIRSATFTTSTSLRAAAARQNRVLPTKYRLLSSLCRM